MFSCSSVRFYSTEIVDFRNVFGIKYTRSTTLVMRVEEGPEGKALPCASASSSNTRNCTQDHTGQVSSSLLHVVVMGTSIYRTLYGEKFWATYTSHLEEHEEVWKSVVTQSAEHWTFLRTTRLSAL